MILADKIIEERKKLGLSQEELADKLSVSRQAVSKWEVAQTVPDLQKIIAMSELFSVSTDYLLKDDAAPERGIAAESESDRPLHRVSMEEAHAYMSAAAEQSRRVALGVLLCILCPVLLIFLSALAEWNRCGITETAASVIGLAALFIQVAAGVFLFVQTGSRMAPFDYLEKEDFETAYGVIGLVKERMSAFEPIYIRFLSLGIILCVLSPLPLIIAALVNPADTLVISMTALLLCLVAIGVYMIVRVATVRSGYRILLQEGEYWKYEKQKNNTASAVSSIYWSLVAAAYLAWSFITFNWTFTWIIWPVAGVLCAPLMMITKQLSGKNK